MSTQDETNERNSKFMERMLRSGRINATDPIRLTIMKSIANADGHLCDGEDDGYYGKLADSVIETLRERGIDLSDA